MHPPFFILKRNVRRSAAAVDSTADGTSSVLGAAAGHASARKKLSRRSSLLGLLLLQLALVELQLLALQDVAVHAAALARPRGNRRQQAAAGKLAVQRLPPPENTQS